MDSRGQTDSRVTGLSSRVTEVCYDVATTVSTANNFPSSDIFLTRIINHCLVFLVLRRKIVCTRSIIIVWKLVHRVWINREK